MARKPVGWRKESKEHREAALLGLRRKRGTHKAARKGGNTKTPEKGRKTKFFLLKSYAVGYSHGIDPNGYPLNCAVDSKTGKILGYHQGGTFSARTIKLIQRPLKEYHAIFDTDEEPHFADVVVHAVNPNIAKALIKDQYHTTQLTNFYVGKYSMKKLKF